VAPGSGASGGPERLAALARTGAGERLCAGVGGALGASAGGARLGQRAAAAGDAERRQREAGDVEARGRERRWALAREPGGAQERQRHQATVQGPAGAVGGGTGVARGGSTGRGSEQRGQEQALERAVAALTQRLKQNAHWKKEQTQGKQKWLHSVVRQRDDVRRS
jgi:hypothetical protein